MRKTAADHRPAANARLFAFFQDAQYFMGAGDDGRRQAGKLQHARQD